MGSVPDPRDKITSGNKWLGAGALLTGDPFLTTGALASSDNQWLNPAKALDPGEMPTNPEVSAPPVPEQDPFAAMLASMQYSETQKKLRASQGRKGTFLTTTGQDLFKLKK